MNTVDRLREISVIGIVSGVDNQGKHGPFGFVCTLPKHQGDVDELTFLVQFRKPTDKRYFRPMRPAWVEDEWPKKGGKVVCWNLTWANTGWRAGFVRNFRPGDDDVNERIKRNREVETEFRSSWNRRKKGR